jgi:voltage-gated potassium channel Kch
MLRRFARFWEQDRGLSVLLLFLVLIILAGGPLARPSMLGGSFLSLLLTLMLGSGVLAVSHRRWAAAIAGGVAVVAIGAEWAGRVSPSPALEVVGATSNFACVAILAAVVLRQVLRAGRITVHRIIGSAAAYLLLGIAWGELYRLLCAIAPGSLVSSAGSALDRSHYLYFSIVTLTTTGYGDITPLLPFARSLMMLEALTGQLFPAILIARLVSMELIARDSD